jgi:glycine/D-amino acid oxidase-like deaminating enzyme
MQSSQYDCVVIGGGIIGCSIALELAEHTDLRIALVEAAAHVAPGASGKAGGFLARHMCDGEAMEPLAHLSFDLHRAFADRIGWDKVQYRPVMAIAASLNVQDRTAGEFERPDFLVPEANVQALSPLESAAQVTPQLLTRQMFDAALATARLTPHFSTCVTSVASIEGKLWQVSGHCAGEPVSLVTERIVLALGPWTNLAAFHCPRPSTRRIRLCSAQVIP